jgi:hypothetical protein
MLNLIPEPDWRLRHKVNGMLVAFLVLCFVFSFWFFLIVAVNQ